MINYKPSSFFGYPPGTPEEWAPRIVDHFPNGETPGIPQVILCFHPGEYGNFTMTNDGIGDLTMKHGDIMGIYMNILRYNGETDDTF